KALEKRTALEIKKSDVDLAVDRRFLMRSSYVLLGIVVAMCLYTVFSPKNISNSVWRALLPASKVTASTKTVILEVTPGNYEVLAHDQLDVTVDLDGVIPEEVRLLYSTTDKRFVDEPLVMRSTGEGLPRFRTRLSGVNGEGLLKDFTYHIEAGDAVSETFFVKIKQPPSATVTEVEFDYPEYMLLDDKTQSSSTIDAWEGVYVTVRAKTNMPIVAANLYRSDNDVAEETADVLPMAKISPDEVELRWRLKFREDGTFANYYFIQVENEAGEKDPLPTIHRIKIRPDLNPEISILFPTEDLEVPANAVIPIAYEANDPDFMLRKVLLKMERQGELLPNVPRLYEGPEVPRVQARYQLDLKPLSLKAGDQLQFYLEAEDNFEPFDQIPKHVSRTSKITLRIVEPVEEEKAEEFQNEQEEQLRNQIADDQQTNEGERPRNEPQPQEKDPTKEETGDKPEEQPADSQPADEGEPTDQAEMKNDPNSDQQDQSSDSSDSTDGNDSNNKGESTGQKIDSTESTEKGNAEDDKPAEDSQTDAEQKTGKGNSSAENSQSDGSKQESKNTKRKGGSESKAEDDQALEELLKWSKDKPEPKEPNGDQSEQQNENPENSTENDPQKKTNSNNDNSKPDEKTGPDSSMNQSESENTTSQENRSSNSPNSDDSEKGESDKPEMPESSNNSESSNTPDKKNENTPDGPPTETNAEQDPKSMKEDAGNPPMDQQPSKNNSPTPENSEDSPSKENSPNEESTTPSPNEGDQTQTSENSEMSDPNQGDPKQGDPKQGDPKQ
ncbi:MAG: hypothetical protein HON04_02360, partial [Planctomicrobium sp.]|nr:hypothetical protein [Planctomicrobium sp.]